MICNKLRGIYSNLKVEMNTISNFTIFFFFLGPYLGHMEVPRLGIELELKALTYATATQDPSLDLHHGSQ